MVVAYGRGLAWMKAPPSTSPCPDALEPTWWNVAQGRRGEEHRMASLSLALKFSRHLTGNIISIKSDKIRRSEEPYDADKDKWPSRSPPRGRHRRQCQQGYLVTPCHPRECTHGRSNH